ncbi:MAG: FAD-dependent oxidoreductase [Alphaproteobacteria bacterium]|nr:FAD-dependent oxidoreductase [Alphaproteobacteria bacterium]
MEELLMIYDLAIIGGGSAGLSVAAAAAQFGEKVVLFEKSEMGGDCLNSGCVPSKALIAAAKYAQAQRAGAAFGVAAVEPQVDYAKVMDHVQRVIAAIAPHDSVERFEGLGVKVVQAAARFVSARRIEAAGEVFEARKIVIATGSRAGVPPIAGLKDVPFLTNETIFKNREKPSHLIIIGGGPIGMEMAQAHRRLGCQVTVLEGLKALGRDDPELSATVIEALAAEGVALREGVAIESVAQAGGKIRVALKGGEVIEGSHLLVAAGRVPNLGGLNLEAAGVAYDRRGISVDASLRSPGNRAVYAAGDAAGGLQFTHVAGYHAGLIIRNALFRLPVKNRTDIIPWVTYTDPELAQVGLNEAEARKAHGTAVKVLKWPFAENDRAQAEGKTKGMVKIITGRGGVILGAAIVGPSAGELIAPFVLAVTQKLKISAFANLVLPYPTLGEAGKRAAITAYAGLAQKPFTRRLLGLLKIFG